MFKVPQEKPIVLFMGRLQHKKDPETFVRAAIESKSDAVFIASGKGELEPKLREIAAGHPNIIITGFLPEKMVPAAYAAADVFAMPSEMETQGLVILEAMASGAVGIATDVGVTREVVRPENVIGFKDYKCLAGRIDAILADDAGREKLAKEGRKLIESEYSIDAMVQKLGRLYEDVSEEVKDL
jgi:glycosyltransferase involved in cell wall biosynthesis